MLDFRHLPGPFFDPSRQENSFVGWGVSAGSGSSGTAAGNRAYGENSLPSLQKL